MHKTLHHPHGDRKVHLRAWHPQRPDPRDDKYSIKLHGALLGGLPTSCDQRPLQSPVEDQGELGACTAHGLADCVEANEGRRQSRKRGLVVGDSGLPIVNTSNVAVGSDGTITFQVSVVSAAPPQPPTPPTPPDPPPQPPTPPDPPPQPPTPPTTLIRSSRLFTYYNTRLIEGTVDQDAGASCRDTIQASVNSGVCDESLWPYDVSQFAVKPPQAAYDAGLKHVITSYHAIADGDLESMKAMIFAGYDVYFGFTCYDELLSSAVASSGLLPMPGASSSIQGGHAVAICGYDDAMQITNGDGSISTGAVLIKNSWGTGWGQAGYFWMPYDYVSNPNLASDFWVIQSSPL